MNYYLPIFCHAETMDIFTDLSALLRHQSQSYDVTKRQSNNDVINSNYR